MHAGKLLLTVVFIFLIVDLFILISTIENVSPLPGKRLPNPFAGFGELSSSQGSQGSPLSVDALRIILQTVLALGTAGILVFVIISRQHRRQFAALFAVLLVLILILAQIQDMLPPAQSTNLQEDIAMVIGSPTNAEPIQVDIPPVDPTNWQVIVVAVGSGLILTVLGAFFFFKIYPAFRLRLFKNDGVLRQLGNSAGQAANRIAAGDDPRSAIIRCYQEMTQIISKHEGIQNYSYLTPREFASRLRQRGMSDDDVDQLTVSYTHLRAHET